MRTVLRRVDPTLWTSELRSATGRSAIKHLLRLLPEYPRVVMPCYVPEGVIDPVTSSGRCRFFYKLKPDLTPDIDDLRECLEEGTTRCFVVVIHYFGLQIKMNDIKALCEDYDALLLEDCAHALWAHAEHADFALWSLNKFMPVTDGAILRSRGVDVGADIHVELPHWVRGYYREHLRLNAQIARETDQHRAAELMEASEGSYELYYSCIIDCTLYRQSAESRMIEAQWGIERDRQLRCDNLARLHLAVPKEFKLEREFRSETPLFAYPIVCRDVARTAVAMELAKAGVIASTLVSRWDHVPAYVNGWFATERYFIDNHLLLPVGDNLTTEEARRIGDVLESFIRKEKAA